MNESEIIEHLKMGWELVNRGNGWFITEPTIPYKSTQSIKVDDALVDDLVKRDIVVEIMKNWSCRGRLK